MNRISNLLIITCFFLASCDAAATTYTDPNLAAQDARATIGAATAIAQSTADEQRRVEREATLEAARTQQASEAEIAAIEAQIRGTQFALDTQATLDTRAQATQEAEATARAAPTQTAISGTQTAIPINATSTSIAALAAYENARADLKMFWLFIILPAAILFFAYLVIHEIIRAFAFRNTLIATPMGLAARDPQWRLLSGDQIIDAPVREISTAPRIKIQPTPSTDERLTMALRLVNDAIKVAGQNSDRIPSWRRLPGWTSGPWQRVKNELEAAGVVYSVEDKGTYLREGHLDNLLYDLQTGQIRLSPTRQ